MVLMIQNFFCRPVWELISTILDFQYLAFCSFIALLLKIWPLWLCILVVQIVWMLRPEKINKKKKECN